MSPLPSDRSSAVSSNNGTNCDAKKHQVQFLRFSHIFASIVREILEVKLLEEVAPHPLTLPQFHLLKAVAYDGAYHVGDVASLLGVSAPAGTKNIDKLERLGFISRTPSKQDRRVTLLTASQKGRRLVRKYESLKAERLAPILDEFTPAELDRLAQLLERFVLSVVENEDSDAGLCLWCAAYCEEDCSVGKARGACPYQQLREAHHSEGAVGRTSCMS